MSIQNRNVPNSHEITAVELTPANVHDCHVFSSLLSGQTNLKNIYADGAYSFKQNFDAIADAGGIPFIPVCSGTGLVNKAPSSGERLRNQLVQDIWKVGGRVVWKKMSGYHRRSLVETHLSRLKTILGGALNSRTLPNQKTEAILRANILNQMTWLGRPLSEKMI